MNNFGFEKTKKFKKTIPIIERELISVECSFCGQEFKGSYFNDYQASGCAAYLEKNGEIHCHFGSELDGDVYAFCKLPAKIEEGIICDRCIKRLIADGKISFLRSDLGFFDVAI